MVKAMLKKAAYGYIAHQHMVKIKTSFQRVTTQNSPLYGVSSSIKGKDLSSWLSGSKKSKVKLCAPGDVLIIKLDKSKVPLFHFLDNDSKPWQSGVIFHSYRNQIKIYCIEFKSGSFPDSSCDQLSASESWCKALQSIIHLYTGKKRAMHLTKYVFSCHENPEPYLDEDNKYLLRDHSIRHYHYREVNGLSLVDLDNDNVERVA